MTRLAAVAGSFSRDVEFDLQRVAAIIDESRAAGTEVLVLPHGVLGGYVGDLDADRDAPPDLPPTLDLGGPEVAQIVDAAGEMVVCFGFTERAVSGSASGKPSNTAVCVDGTGILGVHRKVHLPAGEVPWYEPGDRFAAFDTRVGRVGMLIDYDKTFPEASRSLALDGAELLAFVCAWPLSLTSPAARVAHDRQSILSELYDCSRAAENQVIVVSSNLTGAQGRLRFFGQAKIVQPDGQVVARTGFRSGMATVDLDIGAVVGSARRRLHHLVERRSSAYLTDASSRTSGLAAQPGGHTVGAARTDFG